MSLTAAAEEIASHRKLHLFDIQIKNGQHFRESETLTAGNEDHCL
jgi:omega-amidase